MDKTSDPNDPRGLIYESYRIIGIETPQCRSIFLDWALGMPENKIRKALQSLYQRYSADFPDHPMSLILSEALLTNAAPRKRKGGRQARTGAQNNNGAEKTRLI